MTTDTKLPKSIAVIFASEARTPPGIAALFAAAAKSPGKHLSLADVDSALEGQDVQTRFLIKAELRSRGAIA